MRVKKNGKVQGINFQYWPASTAEQPCLLLIMGYSGSIASWTEDFLEDLNKSFALVMLDNRGTGYSFHPEKVEDITIEAMAQDVHAVVEELGISKFHLLGYSLGGCIAQQYAALHPERLESLILLSTTGGGSLYAPPDRDFLVKLENPQGTTPWEMALHMWSLCLPESAVKAFEKELIKIHDRQMQKATPRRTFAGQMKAFRSFATEKLFPKGCPVPVPVTIISGQEDRLMPHRNSILLHQFWPESHLIEIESCEHIPYLETKEQLIQAIQTVLD